LKSSYQCLLQLLFLFITLTCPSSSSPPTKLLNFSLNMFLSSQTYLQDLISQFEKISQMIFEKRQERSLFLSFSCCFTWIVAASIVTLYFIGQLLLYLNLSPLNFSLLHWPDTMSLFSRPFWTWINPKF
jgi:hypothetical protein